MPGLAGPMRMLLKMQLGCYFKCQEFNGKSCILIVLPILHFEISDDNSRPSDPPYGIGKSAVTWASNYALGYQEMKSFMVRDIGAKTGFWRLCLSNRCGRKSGIAAAQS
jgi:hypothetical protein